MTETTLWDQIPQVAKRIPDTVFNTTNLSGDTLEKRRGKNRSQHWLILEFFRSHPYESFTPSEIEDRRIISGPLTSIRRALTVLTECDYLEKIDGKEGRPFVQRLGKYGEVNFAWRVK